MRMNPPSDCMSHGTMILTLSGVSCVTGTLRSPIHIVTLPSQLLSGTVPLIRSESAIRLYVPRYDDTHAIRCELRHGHFALADPHSHIAEPVIERDRTVDPI